MARDEDAEQATQMRREAAALVDGARRLLAAADALSPSDGAVTDVDFDLLPGKSPRGRAEALLMGRQIRDRLFPDGLFGEPAWELLLGLFLGEGDDRSMSVPAAAELARSSPPTTLRFVDLLKELDLVEWRIPRDDPGGGAIALSRRGMALMSRFFELTEGRAAAPRGRAKLRVVSSTGGDGD